VFLRVVTKFACGEFDFIFREILNGSKEILPENKILLKITKFDRNNGHLPEITKFAKNLKLSPKMKKFSCKMYIEMLFFQHHSKCTAKKFRKNEFRHLQINETNFRHRLKLRSFAKNQFHLKMYLINLRRS
jgi:hypothetical protein